MRIANKSWRRRWFFIGLALCACGWTTGVPSADGAATTPANGPSRVKTPTETRARNTSLTKKRPTRKSRRVRGQQAPTSDRILEIQNALAKDGSYNGESTGKWDGATAEATRKFQAGHGLNATGKLDALTLQKLGLGSAIAGIAAPYTRGASPGAKSEGSPQASTTPRE